jgi:putative ribosome biogenesis GTPase RsgA
MSFTATRYPGARLFSDDALSRKIFFGREREATALTDQILANRMVVVYARSGLGKSSLLNAGRRAAPSRRGLPAPDR